MNEASGNSGSTRAWRYRVLDLGLSPHDGTPIGVSIVEVWEVDGRPIVYRGDAIEMFDGRGGADEPVEAARARLARRAANCLAAIGRPILTRTDIAIHHVTDHPSLDEQLQGYDRPWSDPHPLSAPIGAAFSDAPARDGAA